MVKRSEFPSSCASSGGIVVYLSKIDIVLQWETLKSVIEIRSFLGLDGYYKKFIEVFRS